MYPLGRAIRISLLFLTIIRPFLKISPPIRSASPRLRRAKILHRPSTIDHRPSSIVHRPSSMSAARRFAPCPLLSNNPHYFQNSAPHLLRPPRAQRASIQIVNRKWAPVVPPPGRQEKRNDTNRCRFNIGKYAAGSNTFFAKSLDETRHRHALSLKS